MTFNHEENKIILILIVKNPNTDFIEKAFHKAVVYEKQKLFKSKIYTLQGLLCDSHCMNELLKECFQRSLNLFVTYTGICY